MKAPEPLEKDPADVRLRWHKFVYSTCLFQASLLNIVAVDETDLRKIPDPAYLLAFRKCAELRASCADTEIKLGFRLESLASDVSKALWRLLKPFAKPGAHHIGHLSADVPRGSLPTGRSESDPAVELPDASQDEPKRSKSPLHGEKAT